MGKFSFQSNCEIDRTLKSKWELTSKKTLHFNTNCIKWVKGYDKINEFFFCSCFFFVEKIPFRNNERTNSLYKNNEKGYKNNEKGEI